LCSKFQINNDLKHFTYGIYHNLPARPSVKYSHGMDQINISIE